MIKLDFWPWPDFEKWLPSCCVFSISLLSFILAPTSYIFNLLSESNLFFDLNILSMSQYSLFVPKVLFKSQLNEFNIIYLVVQEGSTECAKLQPTNPYAATKAAAEFIVSSYWECFKVNNCQLICAMFTALYHVDYMHLKLSIKNAFSVLLLLVVQLNFQPVRWDCICCYADFHNTVANLHLCPATSLQNLWKFITYVARVFFCSRNVKNCVF